MPLIGHVYILSFWFDQYSLLRSFLGFILEKRNSLVKSVMLDIIYLFSDEEINDEESLFHPARRKGGARDVECQRISQVLKATSFKLLKSHNKIARFEFLINRYYYNVTGSKKV